MTHLCVTCGTQFLPDDRPPQRCPICEDERQFVGLQGQQWTTLDRLQKSHRNTIYQEAEGIWGILTVPQFGIGQRALLVSTSQGNILWDCVSLINPDTVELIRALGGISAIAISHPHYYTSMVEWSRAFGGVPIYLHEDDRDWVQRPDPVIRFWKGDTYSLAQNLTLIHLGGHFPGFQVLHAASVENGQGAIFSGDQPQVCPDKRYVSFCTATQISFLSTPPACAASFLRSSRLPSPSSTAHGQISLYKRMRRKRCAVPPSATYARSKASR